MRGISWLFEELLAIKKDSAPWSWVVSYSVLNNTFIITPFRPNFTKLVILYMFLYLKFWLFKVRMLYAVFSSILGCSERISLSSAVAMVMEEGIKEYCVRPEHCVSPFLKSNWDKPCMLEIPCLCFSLTIRVTTHCGLALLNTGQPACLLVLHYRKCYSVKGHGHSSTLPSQISLHEHGRKCQQSVL